MKGDEIGRACSTHWEKMNMCRILVGKTERMRSVGSPRRRWDIDLKDLGLDNVDWIDLAPDRDQWRTLVNTVMNIRVP
jgi:hypothetical protein